MLVSIRNRSFHFENLYKLNGDKPRISTLRNNEITGIMPQNLSVFLDDILECFELKEYLKSLSEKDQDALHYFKSKFAQEFILCG